MPPKKRKRAPGGGRKPKGGFPGKLATFTTRITPETRIALERAAEQSGRSISSEAEHWLKTSLIKQGRSLSVHNVALAHAVGLLAERIEKEVKEDWRQNPFAAMALLAAIDMLLHQFATFDRALRTPPSIEVSAAKMPELAERYRNPIGFGCLRALSLIDDIERAPKLRKPKTVEEFNAMFDEWSLPHSFNAPLDVLGLLRLDLTSDKEGTKK